MSTEKDDKSISGLSRRDLLRRTAVGAGTVAVVGGGATKLDHGPVQEAEAIAPAVAAAGIGISAATGWVLRETELVGSNPPAEGLTKDALINEVENTITARASNNQSTFVDNKTIRDQSQHAAYADAKSVAFEAIDDQETESVVVDNAQEAIDEYYTTVLKNLAQSYNETVAELDVMLERLELHEEASVSDAISFDADSHNASYSGVSQEVILEDYTYEFPNGDEMEMHVLDGDGSYTRTDSGSYGDSDWQWQFDEHAGSWSGDDFYVVTEAADTQYLKSDEWIDIISEIESYHQEVRSDIVNWVEGVYGDTQSGDIDTSELLSPRQLEEMSGDGEFSQSTADLQALNISTETNRQAEIHFPEVEATLFGELAYTGEGDLSVGEIDPDEKGSIYLTYDLSQGSGLWTDYEEGLDGGILTLTAEPPEGYFWEIYTTEDETATVDSEEFEYNSEEDVWTTDLSDQLEQTIVDFEIFITTDGSTQYETVQLADPFEIKSITDADGNDVDQIEFDRSEPHTDDNYISQEEWDDQRDRYEELIEKYEESQDGGGGGIGFGGGDSGTLAAAAAVGAAIIFLLGGN